MYTYGRCMLMYGPPSKLKQHHEREGEAGNKDSPDSASERTVGKWRSFKMGIR